jgi:hypothetical protein
MERFIIPGNKTKFIKWLLQTTIDNCWIIVLEYSHEDSPIFLTKNATEVPLPLTGRHQYDANCNLIAIIDPILNDNFINFILVNTHALSIHNGKEMIFLIADDFHEECFSGTFGFFNKYYMSYPETV